MALQYNDASQEMEVILFYVMCLVCLSLYNGNASQEMALRWRSLARDGLHGQWAGYDTRVQGPFVTMC